MTTCEMEKNDLLGREGCGCCAPGTATNGETATAQNQSERQAVEAAPQVYLPAADVVEDEGEALLILDLPGVDATGIDITLEKNILAVKGKPATAGRDGHRLLYAEYGVGEYQRSFILSEDIDREGIRATIKDGVLKVRLPKSASVSKKITVGNE